MRRETEDKGPYGVRSRPSALSRFESWLNYNARVGEW